MYFIFLKSSFPKKPHSSALSLKLNIYPVLSTGCHLQQLHKLDSIIVIILWKRKLKIWEFSNMSNTLELINKKLSLNFTSHDQRMGYYCSD